METRYIRVNDETAIDSKKQILASEIHLLNIAKSINNYLFLRKKELDAKTRLKIAISGLKSKIILIESAFPEPEKNVQRKKEEKFEQISKNSNFQEELEEIKRKLARLG
jgi:hypothetical protein